ncbi:hypothetical protein F8S09_14435 [Deinococcus sp. SDU3-2]|uniref:DUF2059 domain-containing protein n=1 Tax=Deinococcus terrestris TaxID=2651870 RepID=A0A7X1NYJ5_9DEIO|nr:DUF6683 family protein [Deinococcus terrestris]MPY67864.1 hypothetical protein [Deinococcus terrestris]
MSRRILLALTLLLAAPQPASAQGLSGSASSLSSSIFKLMNGTAGTAPAPGQAPATAKPPAPVAKPEALNFKVTPAVRKKVIDTFVGEIASASPEAGAELRKGFASVDVFAEIGKEMKTQFGLSTTNLADVWALYWSYAWLMTQGRTDDPTRAQMVGLRDQFRPLLLSLPAVTGLNDAQKQEMAESLMLQTVLFGILAEGWKDDPASLAEFGQGLQQGTAQMGLDLGLVELTDKGFVVRK